MRCPNCAVENPAGFRFCGGCGKALADTCPACGAEVIAGFRFCGTCGRELAQQVQPGKPSVAAAATTERRRVTVVFADLVGFSSLAEHLDPENLNALVTETLRELTAEVERRGGSVENFAGDSLVAIFGAPQAHEDDPERAVAAAVAIRDAVAHRSETMPTPLRVRVGVNSGVVVAGATGDGRQTGVLGDAVNIAARIESSCKEVGFDILISENTAELLPEYALLDAGTLSLKGKKRRTKLFAVVGDQQVARSPEFVAMRLVHEQLVDALRLRSTTSRKLVKSAKLMAADLTAGLPEFYRRISRRSDHFRDEEIEERKLSVD